MNQFFKYVLASMIGFALAAVALGALFFFMMLGAAATSTPTVSVSKNSVLHLTLDQAMPEQSNNLEMSPFDFSSENIPGLQASIDAIRHAKTDDKISGILIHPDHGTSLGLASAKAFRDALEDFKSSGKWVIAYSKNYSQGAYYLASVADRVYVNPMGMVDIHGFSATIPFFKDLLDKLGIKMQVFYAGDFKSATEPYRLNKMSEQNRLQLREFLEPIFMQYLTDIAEDRKLNVRSLRNTIDTLGVRNAEDAVRYGLADSVAYLDAVMEDLRMRIGLKEDEKVKTVSLPQYVTSYKKDRGKGKEKIAVVYAEGTIVAGKGERGSIGDDKYVKLLRKLRKDEHVKAVVLRVNSPGGSALASENIWREIDLIKEAGKKVVVSMGDYAASGGYYISCEADTIFAQPNTLTGSIGVFSMIPNAKNLFEEKLGIHWDSVKTTKNSVGLTTVFDLSDDEENYLEQMTVEVYERFLQRVAEGRGMHRDSVHKIAQGRIWSGEKAREIGLVDAIGGLDDAIAAAAQMTGLEKYKTVEYPVLPDPITELIEELTGQGDDNAIKAKVMKQELGEFFPYFMHIREVMQTKGPQARLPVMIEFK